MIGMFDVRGADLQPSFGKLDGIFKLGCPGNRASPDSGNRTAHLDSGIGTFFNAPLGLFPVLRQGGSGIGKMMFLFCGNHHQASIGTHTLFLQLDRPVHSTLADRNGRDANLIQINPSFFTALFKPIAAQMGQNLFGIAELRHEKRVSEVGDFNVAASGKNQFFSIKCFCPRRNKSLQVLKSVSDGNIADGHFFGHSWKYFPVIIFGHDFVKPSFHGSFKNAF